MNPSESPVIHASSPEELTQKVTEYIAQQKQQQMLDDGISAGELAASPSTVDRWRMRKKFLVAELEIVSRGLALMEANEDLIIALDDFKKEVDLNAKINSYRN